MKKSLFVLACAMCAAPAFADENAAEHKLDLNIRRIGLEWSRTDIGHSAEYADSPVSAFTATDQDFFKGIFDTALEYVRGRMNWDNSLFMEYGRTTLRPYDGEKTTDENADKILLSSDFSYECWEFGGLKLGPTNRAQYQTEFAAGPSAPRQNVVRDSVGIALFGHEILKTLYVAGVYEYDFTYAHEQTSKIGAELGWRVEYQINDGIAFKTDGYYREYLGFSDYVGTDLKRDLNAVARLDAKLWGDFSMGPYVQYRLARARGEHVYGSNFIMGIGFNYITKFGLL